MSLSRTSTSLTNSLSDKCLLILERNKYWKMGQSISNCKKTKTNITNNNEIFIKRVSLSAHICDDLCEVLLSYLSLED